jgi:hypothetical protein
MDAVLLAFVQRIHIDLAYGETHRGIKETLAQRTLRPFRPVVPEGDDLEMIRVGAKANAVSVGAKRAVAPWQCSTMVIECRDGQAAQCSINASTKPSASSARNASASHSDGRLASPHPSSAAIRQTASDAEGLSYMA